MINISSLDKRELLIALYDNAKIQGMGIFQAKSEPLSLEEAEELLKKHYYFDYLYGRVMKVDLSGDELNPDLYDRDNGDGAVERVIKTISN